MRYTSTEYGTIYFNNLVYSILSYLIFKTQAYPYKNQVYEQLRQQYTAQNLFNDPEFPPSDRSLYYTQRPPRGITWRRPHVIKKNNNKNVPSKIPSFKISKIEIFIFILKQICSNPQFIGKFYS